MDFEGDLAMAEMIDIYDENRKKTGEVADRKTKLKKGNYMLYVVALLQNAEGKFLVTKRTMDKKWAAGAWEIPGGGVALGETSETAVIREVLEETGIDISNANNRVIYSYRNDDEGGDNYFMDMYLCTLDFSLANVVMQESEVMILLVWLIFMECQCNRQNLQYRQFVRL